MILHTYTICMIVVCVPTEEMHEVIIHNVTQSAHNVRHTAHTLSITLGEKSDSVSLLHCCMGEANKKNCITLHIK